MSAAAEGNFRHSMKWLHTWSGLLVGTVLYFMFITGTAGYFNDEISRWMQPELPMVNGSISQKKLLNVAEKRLNEVASESSQWWVDFPIGRQLSLRINWSEKTKNSGGEEGEKWHEEVLNYNTGKPSIARETGGGDTLYYMHYALYYIPNVLAYWITSLCAMFMFIGLITGIVIHRQIFKDFFTFRPGKKQHSWRDMHNVLSVLPLPFHIMITYSGLLFLMFTTMQGVISASYGTGQQNKDRFYDDIYSQGVAHKGAAGITAKNITLSSVLLAVEQRKGENKLSYIGIENRGDINAHIELAAYDYDGLKASEIQIYNGVNGELQHTNKGDESSSAAMNFYNIMTVLHEGDFANYFLRWLYFISGLMGAGMIASGMILWANKRRERANKKGIVSKGLVLVERVNIGTIVGLPIAIAIYFWVNRLLPASFAGRADWEMNGLFISWALMLAYPFCVAHKYTITKIWRDQLIIAAALYGFLPVLNLLTTNTHLGNTLANGYWALAGFDLTMIVFSLCFSFAAYRLHYQQDVTKPATSSLQAIKVSRVKQVNRIIEAAEQ